MTGRVADGALISGMPDRFPASIETVQRREASHEYLRETRPSGTA
jgi:hypothetical protein